jgi:addiction module HigA family antidote
MIDHSTNEYHPTEVSAPGETLLETIEALGMPQSEVARRTGFTPKHINSIISGKAGITAETALRLERVLSVPSHFWLNLEQNYRASLERQRERELIQRRLTSYEKWMSLFPLASMIRLGWLPKTTDRADRVRSLLGFFCIATEEQWSWDRCLGSTTSFRQSQKLKIDMGSVAVWMWKGFTEAQRIPCKPFSASQFKKALIEARKLSRSESSSTWTILQGMCADAGVALVSVPGLPKTRTYGAARWVSPQKAMIQLSLRGKTDDQFWFSFFHEAGHILLHGKTESFIDSEDSGDHSNEEIQANAYAMDILIPRDQWIDFVQSHRMISPRSIIDFANRLGIAPGIVVGRLQKEAVIQYNQCNSLKRRIDMDSLTTS